MIENMTKEELLKQIKHIENVNSKIETQRLREYNELLDKIKNTRDDINDLRSYLTRFSIDIIKDKLADISKRLENYL